MLSTELITNVTKQIEEKEFNIEYFQDQIVLIDNEKSLYDSAIAFIDSDVLGSIVDVNNSFDDVQSAYQDRIDAGCRTDLFWRVIDQVDDGFGGYSYTLSVSQLSVIGYNPIGIGTGTVGIDGDELVIVEPSGGISTYPRTTSIGVQQKNKYGLKYYDEPYAKDIGDTFVTSFIGTISLGSNKLTVMNPVGAGISELFQVDQIVTTSKVGIFPVLTPVKITGIGLTEVDLTAVNPGIGTTSSTVNILTLDTVASASVKAPELDGSFVGFTVISDPADVASEGRRKYELNFFSDPFNPQTVGIMEGNAGIGVSIALDNSGSPSASQGWNSDLNGYEIDGATITPPNVGADRLFYTEGFTSIPSYLGVPQGIGVSITVSSLTSLYTSLPTCSTQDATLSTKIGIASAKENAFTANGDVNLKINASNALRLERNEYYLRTWGLRQSIGKENEEIDRYDSLRAYIGLTTISGTLG